MASTPKISLTASTPFRYSTGRLIIVLTCTCFYSIFSQPGLSRCRGRLPDRAEHGQRFWTAGYVAVEPRDRRDRLGSGRHQPDHDQLPDGPRTDRHFCGASFGVGQRLQR